MKDKKSFILGAILCAGVLCGCTGSKFIMDKKADNYTNIQTYSERDHFFFWGMSRKHEHDFSDICPNGKIVKMTTNNDWIDELLVACTMGIYYTRTFTVYCATDPVANDKSQK
ncbi:MAG: hypothetical protein IKN49_07045 [Elusimicrobiaceae bacterium]|nr:hypothetical protein [Elusimicrobiaceae bacterium]